MFQPKGRERETWVTLVQLTITSMFGVVIFVPGCQLFFNSIRLFNSSRIKSADFHFQSTLRIFCTNDTYTKKKQLLGANLFFSTVLFGLFYLHLFRFVFIHFVIASFSELFSLLLWFFSFFNLIELADCHFHITTKAFPLLGIYLNCHSMFKAKP